MNKQQYDHYTARKALQNAGWDVANDDIIRFHSGDETHHHFTTKAQAAYFLREQGYRIDSEVQNEYSGAIADLIAYRDPDDAFVVEAETNPTPAVTDTKLDQFYHGEPFAECYILDTTDLPTDRDDQLEWIQSHLGGPLP